MALEPFSPSPSPGRMLETPCRAPERQEELPQLPSPPSAVTAEPVAASSPRSDAETGAETGSMASPEQGERDVPPSPADVASVASVASEENVAVMYLGAAESRGTIVQVWYPLAIRGPRTAENAAGQVLSLARRRSVDAEHHRLCIAAGSSVKVTSRDPEKAQDENRSESRDPHQVFRVRKFFWDIGTENLFLPRTATGIHLCLCHVVISKLKTSEALICLWKDLPFYTWVESKCPKGAKKELCFNTMGPADVLNAVHLVDEVVLQSATGPSQ
eukprot:s5529_g5.t1